MARPMRTHPIPALRTRGTAFYLRWYANKKQYEISLGDIDKSTARTICIATGAAMANRGPYPDEILNEPALKRYILASENIRILSTDEELIEAYLKHLKAKNNTSLWHVAVKTHLQRTLKFIGSLQNAKPRELQTLLDSIATETSPATSNRARTALSGFFRWLRNNGYHPKNYNPLADIKKFREESPHDGIVIWEGGEVKALLKAANKRRDGIAVWIAILAGLRRGEIARLKWSDVSESYLLIGKSKTGKKRQVPLSSLLSKRLAKEPRTSPYVVPWPEKPNGWMSAAIKLTNLYLKRYLPKVYEKHPEKFSWNAFRHTFASRHAQNGLSLDIIAAWMGDSPQVCKDHYARYVPKNARDKRIDAADPKF